MSEESDGLVYHRDRLRNLIWSGFLNEDDWKVEAEDLAYDPDAEQHIEDLSAFAQDEMAAKKQAEQTWPAITDWDRLDSVFSKLVNKGILALHNAGYTRQDAHGDAWETISSDETGRWRGFTYYHGQDVERAVEGLPLYLGFDSVDDCDESKRSVGNEIVVAFEEAGFEVDWNSDPETRLSITNLDWKKRTGWTEDLTDPEDESPSDGPTPAGHANFLSALRNLFRL